MRSEAALVALLLLSWPAVAADLVSWTVEQTQGEPPRFSERPHRVTGGTAGVLAGGDTRTFTVDPGPPAYHPRRWTERDGAFAYLTATGPLEPAEGELLTGLDLSKRWAVSVDPSAPVTLRAAVEHGVRVWNEALAATGLPEVFAFALAEPPGTLRTVRVMWWDRAPELDGVAITRIASLPDTGEVLTAMMVVDAHVVAQSARVHPQVLQPCGTAPPADPLAATLRGVVVHELGHLLGLDHNLAASADVANRAPGTWSTSAMDVLPAHLTPDRPLVYDLAAIADRYRGRRPETAAPLYCRPKHRERVEADASVYDAGDPFALADCAAKRAATARCGASELRDVLGAAFAGLVKLVYQRDDPRHARAVAEVERLLGDGVCDAARIALLIVLHNRKKDALLTVPEADLKRLAAAVERLRDEPGELGEDAKECLDVLR